MAKETYKCQHRAFIDKAMRKELDIMQNILENLKKFRLDTPIAHVIKREPDFTSYGDASLDAGGGFSNNLFWWHVEWPAEIKALTIKSITITRRFPDAGNLVSINLLEFVVEIINYAAVTTLFSGDSSLCSHDYPILLNWTDNITSQSWLRKAASRTNKGRSLQHLLCSIMINNPVRIKDEHIAGSSNTLADAISRVHSFSQSKSFEKKLHQFPQMKSWKRFHPSRELLSVLYLGLSKEHDPGLCRPKELGHFAPGSSISKKFYT